MLLQMMDSLPPNDPSRNNNFIPEEPNKGNNSQGNGRPIEVFANMQDSPMVVAMFLVGVATWFLRERCIC